MGNKDIRFARYLDDRKKFSDLFNGGLFQGENVIDAKYLEAADTQTNTVEQGRTLKRTVDKRMRYKNHCRMLLLVVENQNAVDYGMVLRTLLTEGMEYDRQRKGLMDKHRTEKDAGSSGEFLSGMKKEDRVEAVLTLVVYHGKEPWDAKRELYDLINLDGFKAKEREEIKHYVNNYRINVFDYHEYENFDIFQTELRQVFTFIKNAEDKRKIRKMVEENPRDWYNVSTETWELIAELTNSRKLLEVIEERQEGETLNMCKALDDLYNDGVEKGIEQGIEQGIERGIEKGVRILIQTCMEVNVDKDTTKKKIRDMEISEEQAERYLEKYWSRR